MDHSIKNLLPNIQKYVNRKLLNSRIENNTWYDTFNGIEYSFMKGNRLVVEIKGQIVEGRWELLPNDKIIINLDGTALAYNILFFKEHWIILLHPLQDNQPLLLSDSAEANLIVLIQELNSHTISKQVDYVSIDGKSTLTKDMFVEGYIQFGSRLREKHTNLDKEYRHVKMKTKYIQLKDGVVVDEYHIRGYDTKYGILWFKQKEYFIQKGDVVHNKSKNELRLIWENTSIAFDDYYFKFNKKGIIEGVKIFV
jgi:hypothetical protein